MSLSDVIALKEQDRKKNRKRKKRKEKVTVLTSGA